jgi:hypothetical protein
MEQKTVDRGTCEQTEMLRMIRKDVRSIGHQIEAIAEWGKLVDEMQMKKGWLNERRLD